MRLELIKAEKEFKHLFKPRKEYTLLRGGLWSGFTL